MHTVPAHVDAIDVSVVPATSNIERVGAVIGVGTIVYSALNVIGWLGVGNAGVADNETVVCCGVGGVPDPPELGTSTEHGDAA